MLPHLVFLLTSGRSISGLVAEYIVAIDAIPVSSTCCVDTPNHKPYTLICRSLLMSPWMVQTSPFGKGIGLLLEGCVRKGTYKDHCISLDVISIHI